MEPHDDFGEVAPLRSAADPGKQECATEPRPKKTGKNLKLSVARTSRSIQRWERITEQPSARYAGVDPDFDSEA